MSESLTWRLHGVDKVLPGPLAVPLCDSQEELSRKLRSFSLIVLLPVSKDTIFSFVPNLKAEI